MITQLNPPLPLSTPKGPGLAHFLIDYGPEASLLWVVFLDKDGACWTVPNAEVRMTYNWSLNRRRPDSTDDNNQSLETPLVPNTSDVVADVVAPEWPKTGSPTRRFGGARP